MIHPPLLAVHISDGLLTESWWVGGIVIAAALAFVGAWRIQEEDIPRVSLMAAAFFVASLIHVSLRVTSVHLLLNGLLGVVLGRRAALAIPLSLFLQAILLQHGGLTTLGVNSCVMVLPALCSGSLFAGLRRFPWVRHSWFRALLTGLSFTLWLMSAAIGLSLLFKEDLRESPPVYLGLAFVFCLILSAIAVVLERRLENSPEFPVGLLIGELAVLLTVFLNSLVLYWGLGEDWRSLIILNFLAHLPIAAIEGIVVGFTMGFLVKVKPEIIGWAPAENSQCPADATS